MLPEPNRNRPPGQSEGPPGWQVFVLLNVIIMGAILFVLLSPPIAETSTLPYSSVKKMIREGEIVSASFGEHEVTVTTATPDEDGVGKYRAVIPAQGDPELLSLLEEQGVEISATEPTRDSILVYMLPWILILGVYVLLADRKGRPADFSADGSQSRKRPNRE